MVQKQNERVEEKQKAVTSSNVSM
ncbi:uncharacterized protein METZ01_LOCUS394617, partial [marine metagenome]